MVMVIEYLTGILAFITAIYAYLTYRMAKASEASVEAVSAQSEAMLRRYVTVAPFIRSHTPFCLSSSHELGAHRCAKPPFDA
jgi:hypothetical protein